MYHPHSPHPIPACRTASHTHADTPPLDRPGGRGRPVLRLRGARRRVSGGPAAHARAPPGATHPQPGRGASACPRACPALPCSIDDTDKRAKALWLPVQGQDCPATCTGAGLVAVTLAPADFSRAACSGFPRRDDDDDFYIGACGLHGLLEGCWPGLAPPHRAAAAAVPRCARHQPAAALAPPATAGTWRNQGGVRVCQAADDDDDAKARLFYDRYYCACLPRKVRRAPPLPHGRQRQRRRSAPLPARPLHDCSRLPAAGRGGRCPRAGASTPAGPRGHLQGAHAARRPPCSHRSPAAR